MLTLAAGGLVFAGRVVARVRAITIQTGELAGPPLMGLGVQWDPYDSFRPTPADWKLTFQRLDYMRPGFIRVVEPAYDYFAGYDAKHNPKYRWNSVHVQQLLQILGYAKSRGITVILGDWSNPMINGDARIPAEFLAQLHDGYGYTNIKYFNLINEPNYQAGCDFGCWTGMVSALSSEFTNLGLSRWLELVGPDNATSWDDTSAAQALDWAVGLDADNPLGGDSWVTDTLHAIPGLIGAYDSHRYATIWGTENGVWEDQLRARREEINNLDSPTKPYFAGELGLTARQVTPFSARAARSSMQSLAALVDPSSAPRVSSFVDSQPHIREFVYGVWMGDLMVQGIAAGLSGASAWDLDDAMHVGGQYGSQNLKQWGFWNSLGGQDGYPASDRRLRPWYYPWSVLARSFPAGSRPLLVPSTGVPGLRVAAAKIPNAGKYDLSFAVVNDSDAARAIRLAVPSATAPVTLARYDYFAADRPTDGSGFPVPKRVLQQVDLSQGVTLHLPTRGVVVLSSVGYDAPIALSDSASRLVDDLTDWHQVYLHSGRLRLDHDDPAEFNYDRSRVTVTKKAKRAQYLIYRASQITSFELKAYSQRPPGIRAYASPDGTTWTPISLESTKPAPTVGGGYWSFAELLPAGALGAVTNELMIKLTNHRTELGQVAIESGSG